MAISQEFLKMAQTYRVLSDLDPQHLSKLLPLAESHHFDRGQIIFHEGGKSLFLHLIVSGEVALEMVIGGPTVPVQTLHAGEAMGWSALSVDNRAHFQARALTSVTTVAFPSQRLREACEQDPKMGYELMKSLLELVAERLDATRIQLVNTHRLAEPAHVR